MGSEALLPQARGEFCDAAGGMHADALQDIDEVGVGIDVVQATSDDERLDDADMLGAELGPAEQPRLSAHGDHTQRALQMIGIDRHVGISEKDLEAGASLARIGERLGERVRRREPLALKLGIDPVEEALEERLAVGEAMQPLGLAGQGERADLFLHGIEGLDLLEPLLDRRRISRVGFE